MEPPGPKPPALSLSLSRRPGLTPQVLAGQIQADVRSLPPRLPLPGQQWWKVSSPFTHKLVPLPWGSAGPW